MKLVMVDGETDDQNQNNDLINHYFHLFQHGESQTIKNHKNEILSEMITRLKNEIINPPRSIRNSKIKVC